MDITEFLVGRKVNVNAKNNDGKTALDLAQNDGNFLRRILEISHFDIQLIFITGKTHLIEYLKKHGAHTSSKP